MKYTGGGAFDPTEKNVHFLASTPKVLDFVADMYQYLLTPVNDATSASDFEMIENWISAGKKVFLDSGIFNLAMVHAKEHGISHNKALLLQPEEVDGFWGLLERYRTIVERFGDGLWGYVELDLGGREAKKKTRAMLEDQLGMRPIPVYHPLGDGWDYFDELASQYDRICVGNIVQAAAPTRMRILATIAERKQAYPHLWVHALGMTPNDHLLAYPMESSDSSSWLSSIRWNGGLREAAAGKTLGGVPEGFKYTIGSDAQSRTGHIAATRLAAYVTRCVSMNVRAGVKERES